MKDWVVVIAVALAEAIFLSTLLVTNNTEVPKMDIPLTEIHRITTREAKEMVSELPPGTYGTFCEEHQAFGRH